MSVEEEVAFEFRDDDPPEVREMLERVRKIRMETLQRKRAVEEENERKQSSIKE